MMEAHYKKDARLHVKGASYIFYSLLSFHPSIINHVQ